MRRLTPRKQHESVTLFPFLAVLICTMGSLIVLLVMVVKQADAHAKVKSSEQLAQLANERNKLEVEQEREDFRRQMLRELRPDVTKRLAQRRAELGYLEENLRELRKEAERVRRKLRALDDSGQHRDVDVRSLRERLEILREEIEKTRQQVAEARAKADEKPRSFAIIPYDGGNGTRRRPVYIECTKHGIIIQPEGIVLGPNDFKPPLLPGNPLDAALLATRQHLNRVHRERSGDPYPLLVVRPDGTEAYQFARAAMKSWDDEFGYELIDQDTPLAFPPADPQLASLLRETIQDARRRQAALAAAQPSRFRAGTGGREGLGGGAYGLRASPTGGFVMEPLDGTGSTSRDYDRGDDDFRRQIIGASSGQSATDQSDGGSSSPGSADRRHDSLAENAPGSPASTSDHANHQPFNDRRQPPQHFSPGGERQPRRPDPGQATAASSRGFGRPSRGGGNLGAGATGAGGAVPQSLARGRGADWALPQKAPGAVAIRRPIRMLCFADHLVIKPGLGSDEDAKIVNFDGSTLASINRFTSQIWSHMDGWGTAGRNAYWRPDIKVEVAPNGEQRFRELDALMTDSGFDFERVAP